MAPKLGAVEIVPDTRDVSRLADYVELRALVSIDATYSLSDLIEDIKRGKGIGLQEIDEDPERAGDDDDDEVYAEDEAPAHHAGTVDRIDRLATDVFEHLQFRAKFLEKSYPFEVSSGVSRLTVDKSLGDIAVFYEFLLLASTLSYVDASSRQRITKYFEVICAALLGDLLAWRGRVHVFGTAAGQAGSPFNGNLWKKVQQLAALLGEKVKVGESEFKKNDVGDNGLDIIGHFDFGDGASGRIVLFGQCACTLDWENKQHSASQDTWDPIMSFGQPIVPLTFIPHFFRDSNGGWARLRSIHRTVVLDRRRLLDAFGLGKTKLPADLRKLLIDLVPFRFRRGRLRPLRARRGRSVSTDQA